ncbi:hypothetical protein OG599_23385 [Streptomyces sp. NBC_01335]|uniref:hypothetical protein n=1 Tax=Streptomyces sp. NBC_01335 TaxID=2903828 RepID=UPI002E10E88A|nr:hypothetical protein OG599_23385 [Streptomyces sp. NBC_01335]
MTSWPALAGAAAFAALSAQSWRRVIRLKRAPSAPMALARLFGPAARRRLEQASWLNAVCQSGELLVLR